MDASLQNRITNFVENEAKKIGLVVLHAVFRGSENRPVIEFTLDGDRLISISDCETISKSTLQFIDTNINNSINYRLDIFSPGIDEPLKYDFQLKRSAGKPVRVEFDVEGRKTEKTGTLLNFTDDEIGILEIQRLGKKKTSPKGEEVRILRKKITLLKQIALIH